MSYTKDSFRSSWSETRVGVNLTNMEAYFKLLCRIFASSVSDCHSKKQAVRLSAEDYVFDVDHSEEEIWTFKKICGFLGLDQKSVCRVIQDGLHPKLVVLARSGAKNNKRAMEFVGSVRKYIISNGKYVEKKPTTRVKRRRKPNKDL